MIFAKPKMVLTLALMASLLLVIPAPLSAKPRPYLRSAIEAAQWIRASAIRTDHGTVWPADPRDPKTVSTDLYSGTPGVVLFFLELHRTTGDRIYLDDARAGSEYLLAHLPEEKGTGLYEGIAGIGFILEETFKHTGERKYREGVQQCVQLLSERAVKVGRGVEWSDTTDIISGSAGTGLFLLYAARELKGSSVGANARELSILAGRRLIELGTAAGDGKKWSMSPRVSRLMPNFSHGTAGIAYFLATLYRETRRREFLEAAIAGARHLQAIANTEGDACMIYHHQPGGENLYYLSWCHGPPGTARLFYRLYQVTGDPVWMSWVRKAARADLTSGIPEKQTPGFWNNVSQCCGSAGVGEFMLSLYRATGNRTYLNFAKRLTANLLARATPDSSGLKWIQAEHRVRPELVVAQTGYMQGAAGIGMWLLRLDAAERSRKETITFPDSPF